MDLLKFKDILKYRRNEFSNYMWISRELSAYTPDSKIIPKTHKLSVASSKKMQILILKLSKENNTPEKVFEEQVKLMLDEIGFDRHLSVMRWLAYFLTKICNTVCTSIYINEDNILPLKPILKTTPVIYMPNHRSYADFILMSYVLFTMDITLPAIAAGMDFYSMRGMATMLRNTGAFYMRRSYNEDQLYWYTFRQYINQVVTKGESGIEFFIEGMRSRSNKALPPKFGLLFMVLRAFITSEVPDIHLVPINISYDRIMEERLFAYEHLGVPKPKETTKGFFKSLSILKESYGSIYINFGSPISARDYLNGNVNRIKHALKPIHMQELSAEDKSEIVKLGEHIVDSQKQLTVLNTFNIIAVILTNNYFNGKQVITKSDLMHEVIWFKTIIEKCGIMTSIQNLQCDIEEVLNVHKNLLSVDYNLNISIVQNPVQVKTLDPKVLKGHALSEDIMKIAVPFITLQIYVNPVLQLIVNQCILVTVFKSNKDGMKKDNILKEYMYLRKLFCKEFTLFNNKEVKNFEESLETLIGFEVVYQKEGIYNHDESKKISIFLINLFKPFLSSYYLVCHTLKNLQPKSYEERTILALSQEKIQSFMKLRGGEFIHPYSLSLNSISQCLQTLVALDAVIKKGVYGSVLYEMNYSKLIDHLQQLGKYVPHYYNGTYNEKLHLKTKL